MNKVVIVDTRNMGRVLGLALANKGYEAFFGARDESKAEYSATFNKKCKYGSNQQAADFGEIIYYASRGIHPEKVVRNLSSLDGKIVIESGNVELSN